MTPRWGLYWLAECPTRFYRRRPLRKSAAECAAATGRFASHGVANGFPANETTPCGAGGCGRVHRGAKPASGSGWESNPPGDFSDATLGLKPRTVTRSAYTPGKPTVAAGLFDRRGREESSQIRGATGVTGATSAVSSLVTSPAERCRRPRVAVRPAGRVPVGLRWEPDRKRRSEMGQELSDGAIGPASAVGQGVASPWPTG